MDSSLLLGPGILLSYRTLKRLQRFSVNITTLLLKIPAKETSILTMTTSYVHFLEVKVFLSFLSLYCITLIILPANYSYQNIGLKVIIPIRNE